TGENDDVVVDGVGEADLGLGSSRSEDQVLRPTAGTTQERAEGEDRVTGELAFLRQLISVERQDLVEGGDRLQLVLSRPRERVNSSLEQRRERGLGAVEGAVFAKKNPH